jgi:hypothetical protein
MEITFRLRKMDQEMHKVRKLMGPVAIDDDYEKDKEEEGDITGVRKVTVEKVYGDFKRLHQHI